MGITGLEQLVALERRLEGVEARAATRAAPALLAVAKSQWSVGQAPDGTTWPRTKDGRVPLTALTSQATARAEGTEVVIELPEECAYHQAGDPPRLPQRKIVPDDGDDPPPAWVTPIEDAIRVELEGG